MSQWMTSTSARTSGVPNPGPTLPPEVSLTEYAASTVASPQPAWRTLNIARERAFTGELRFATAPAITVFVDGGSVYFAERHGDTPLGERLVAAGVVTPQQLERGVVRVGGAEHLGRLFDRDPDVDRDAVMVVVESSTEALVAELAAEIVAAVEVNPYRHHQSGVHRWFVAPIDVSLSRPVSDVAQVDRSVIDDLPGLPAPTSAVRIEWDQPDVAGFAPPAPAQAVAPSTFDDVTDDATARDAAPAGPSVDPIADSGIAAAGDQPDGAADEADAWLEDFQIVWPDGSEELAAPSPRRVTPVSPSASVDAVQQPSSEQPSSEQPSSEQQGPAPQSVAPRVDASTLSAAPTHDDDATVRPTAARATPIATSTATPTATPAAAPAASVGSSGAGEQDADANVSFAMPQLRIDTPPAPGADVPDDVADAVRRALQAIEQAATQPRPLPQIDLAPITLPELRLPTLGDATDATVAPQPTPSAATSPSTVAPSDQPSTVASSTVASSAVAPSNDARPAEAAPVVEPVTSGPAAGSFAPPTAEMSAESVYERLAAEQMAAEQLAAQSAAAAATPAPTPEPGQASVVFVDDETDDASTRKGALRRLIGSLRRGD